MLAPLDILVLLKICAKRGEPWVQQDIAYELKIGQSSVHKAMKVAQEVKLYSSNRKRVNVPKLEEALFHGARYFLAAKRGGETRGMPTSWAAPPLSMLLSASSAAIPVWPDPNGEARGYSLEPLHKTVPEAARQDLFLYELLALVDALREGHARESKLAEKELHLRLEQA